MKVKMYQKLPGKGQTLTFDGISFNEWNLEPFGQSTAQERLWNVSASLFVLQDLRNSDSQRVRGQEAVDFVEEIDDGISRSCRSELLFAGSDDRQVVADPDCVLVDGMADPRESFRLDAAGRVLAET